jgi:hypothetical protein
MGIGDFEGGGNALYARMLQWIYLVAIKTVYVETHE